MRKARISNGEKSADGHRDERGRFKLGNCGGPGRPRGTSRADALREALGEDLDKIVDAVRAQALAGDLQAVRLLLDRTLAPLRAAEDAVRLDLPEGSLVQRGDAILAAVAAGEVSPTQGTALMGALAGLARLVEVSELDARITALEAKNAKS